MNNVIENAPKLLTDNEFIDALLVFPRFLTSIGKFLMETQVTESLTLMNIVMGMVLMTIFASWIGTELGKRKQKD